jgi:hypothetical protein
MKSLYESILDNPSAELDKDIDLKLVLKKYHWYYKKASWKGDTLYVVFDGRGYMDDFVAVMNELNCKKVEVYPWAIIDNAQELKDFTIKAATRVDIYADTLQNCTFIAGSRVTIDPRGKRLTMAKCNIESGGLRLNDIDDVVLRNNNFDKIDSLTLSNVGSHIESCVLDWGIVKLKGSAWTTYGATGVEPTFNPVDCIEKQLGAKFKRLSSLTIAKQTGGDNIFVRAYSVNTHKRFDWGISNLTDLTNGWQIWAESDARSI